MASTLPPKMVNGNLNSIFNANDFISQTDAKYDAKYLKLTGGTITGGLTSNTLTVNSTTTLTGALTVNNTTTTNGITSSSGINQFNSNITLPTTYTVSPNATFPTSSQLGGVFVVNETNGQSAATGVVKTICSLQLSPGVYCISWRGVIAPTAAGNGTYTNVRFALTPTLDTITPADHVQRVQICSSQTATQGATHGYECALIGSTILQVSALTTYYLNGCSVYTSSTVSKWTGHIHAVRIA